MPPTAPRRRVPVGIFLATTCHPETGTSRTAGRLPAWHGAPPAAVAEIIAAYTTDGDLIIDLDAHPTIAAAAWFLHRVPATLAPGSDGQQIRPLPPPPDQPAPPDGMPHSAAGHPSRAALMLATLPRPDHSASVGDGAGPGALVRAMQRWQTLIRPGGFLILTPVDSGPDRSGAGRVRLRAAIIAAAQTAGLRWHQHLLIITGLPGHDRRHQPPPTGVGARLLGGRHIPAHHTPLVFTTVDAPEDAHA